jgi:GNAT superfamily N-acetyltransferase
MRHSACCIIILFAYNQIYAILHFETTQSKQYAHFDIHLYNDKQHIGFVSYCKIALVPFYVIHNLYVYPQYRKQGYGKKLLIYVCDSIKNQGAKKAYIQPGPFEIIDGKTVGIDPLYKQEIKRLITFYQDYGFDNVGHTLSVIASFVYRLMNIDEDAQYLMVKNFD